MTEKRIADDSQKTDKHLLDLRKVISVSQTRFTIIDTTKIVRA